MRDKQSWKNFFFQSLQKHTQFGFHQPPKHLTLFRTLDSLEPLKTINSTMISEVSVLYSVERKKQLNDFIIRYYSKHSLTNYFFFLLGVVGLGTIIFSGSTWFYSSKIHTVPGNTLGKCLSKKRFSKNHCTIIIIIIIKKPRAASCISATVSQENQSDSVWVDFLWGISL